MPCLPAPPSSTKDISIVSSTGSTSRPWRASTIESYLMFWPILSTAGSAITGRSASIASFRRICFGALAAAAPAPSAAATRATPAAAQRRIPATVSASPAAPGCRFHVKTAAGRRAHPATQTASGSTATAGSESANAVLPGRVSTSTFPFMRSASSRAIARPRPLPDACGPSTR